MADSNRGMSVAPSQRTIVHRWYEQLPLHCQTTMAGHDATSPQPLEADSG